MSVLVLIYLIVIYVFQRLRYTRSFAVIRILRLYELPTGDASDTQEPSRLWTLDNRLQNTALYAVACQTDGRSMWQTLAAGSRHTQARKKTDRLDERKARIAGVHVPTHITVLLTTGVAVGYGKPTV